MNKYLPAGSGNGDTAWVGSIDLNRRNLDAAMMEFNSLLAGLPRFDAAWLVSILDQPGEPSPVNWQVSQYRLTVVMNLSAFEAGDCRFMVRAWSLTADHNKIYQPRLSVDLTAILNNNDVADLWVDCGPNLLVAIALVHDHQ